MKDIDKVGGFELDVATKQSGNINYVLRLAVSPIVFICVFLWVFFKHLLFGDSGAGQPSTRTTHSDYDDTRSTESAVEDELAVHEVEPWDWIDYGIYISSRDDEWDQWK